MTGTIRNFYASGNTASGFYSFNDSILQDVQQLFILKGGPGTGKSSLMKSIAEQVLDRGYDLELMHSPLDNDSLDGVIIPILGVGIVNGTSPYVIDPKYPGVREEIVHLAEGWNVKRLRENRGRVIQLTDQITDTLTKAYEHFGQAKEIHLEREDVYLKGMNFEKANQVTSELYESLFSGEQCENEESLVTNGKEKHMFFGAATPRGVVHFIDNLTEIVDKRIIVKGRPGSGKSTMLKKIVQEATKLGYRTEVYHCGFDPNSLDMILIPQLGYAILDGTSPHEMEPTRDGDEILDMYERCFDIDIDREYATQLEEINQRYKEQTKWGITCLAEAKLLQDQLEEIYVEAVDFAKVNEKKEYIWSRIEEEMGQHTTEE